MKKSEVVRAWTQDNFNAKRGAEPWLPVPCLGALTVRRLRGRPDAPSADGGRSAGAGQACGAPATACHQRRHGLTLLPRAQRKERRRAEKAAKRERKEKKRKKRERKEKRRERKRARRSSDSKER